MDYAFVSGVIGWELDAKELLTNRPNTQLVQGRNLKTVHDFLQYVSTTGVALPAGDLFIASHGNDLAWMRVPLDATQIHPGKPDDTTSYEVVKAAVVSGSVKIPGNVNHDSTGTLTSTSVNIRGCRIGASEPFTDELKLAFGNESPVTAPKHFHGIKPLPGVGSLEFLAYSFGVVAQKPFPNKAAVVAALIAEQFTYRDDTTEVPAAMWSDWVTKNVTPGKRKTRVSVDLGRTLGGQPRTDLAIEFRHEVPPPFSYAISGLPALPGTKADRLATLNQQLTEDANTPGSTFADDYPVPTYERFGQSSIDEFVNNLEWGFTWQSGDMICTGTQHEYTVLVPITDSDDLKTGKLIYNFYPTPGNSDAAVDELLLSDATMFYTA